MGLFAGIAKGLGSGLQSVAQTTREERLAKEKTSSDQAIWAARQDRLQEMGIEKVEHGQKLRNEAQVAKEDRDESRKGMETFTDAKGNVLQRKKGSSDDFEPAYKATQTKSEKGLFSITRDQLKAPLKTSKTTKNNPPADVQTHKYLMDQLDLGPEEAWSTLKRSKGDPRKLYAELYDGRRQWVGNNYKKETEDESAKHVNNVMSRAGFDGFGDKPPQPAIMNHMDLMQKAKEAISKGANPEAVKQRLKEMGLPRSYYRGLK